MKKKFPIGIQSFEKIRKGDYYYVDKTPFVAKLTEEGSYYFLSRPRRFGKSLFIDTLKQAFLGKRGLFEGLYLERNWDWSRVHPVIHISFGQMTVKTPETLEELITSIINEHAENHNITLRERLIERRFNQLIVSLYKKYNEKVVVLVDEYDKPVLDRIENKAIAISIREILKSFYSVFKDADAYLKFVFITGVSKFSKVSLFSGLNQLQDITLNPVYATICGYTQEEFEKIFEEEIRGEDLNSIKCWYNGYSFCGEPLYNPFDVLLYLSERQFRPYWFETGTPSFLIKLLMHKRFPIPELEEITTGEDLIGSFDVDFIEPEPVLFQAGYLTIKDYESSPSGIIYHLGYPNKEVKVSLNRAVLNYFTQSTKPLRLTKDAYEALREARLNRLEEILKNIFYSIPYEWYRKNNIAEYEGYYASVVYSFLVGTGLEVVAEDYTGRGRIDLTVRVDDKAYVVEFKIMESEEDSPRALETLKSRGYWEKYAGICKEIYLVGIDFSTKIRNIAHFAWEKYPVKVAKGRTRS